MYRVGVFVVGGTAEARPCRVPLPRRLSVYHRQTSSLKSNFTRQAFDRISTLVAASLSCCNEIRRVHLTVSPLGWSQKMTEGLHVRLAWGGVTYSWLLKLTRSCRLLRSGKTLSIPFSRRLAHMVWVAYSRNVGTPQVCDFDAVVRPARDMGKRSRRRHCAQLRQGPSGNDRQASACRPSAPKCFSARTLATVHSIMLMREGDDEGIVSLNQWITQLPEVKFNDAMVTCSTLLIAVLIREVACCSETKLTPGDM